MNENLEKHHSENDPANPETDLKVESGDTRIELLLSDIRNLQNNLAQCDADRKILETEKNKLLADISIFQIKEAENSTTINSLNLKLLEINKKLENANEKNNKLELQLKSDNEKAKELSAKNTSLENSILIFQEDLIKKESNYNLLQSQKFSLEKAIKQQTEQISNFELQIAKLKKSNFRKPIYAIIFTFILTVFSVLLAIILFGTTERYALNKCGQKKKIPSHIPVAQVKKSIVKPSNPPFEHTIEFGENGDAQLITPSPSKSSEYASSGSDSDQLNEESEENPNASSVDDREDSTPKVASPIVIEEKNLLNLINNLSSNLSPDAESKILQLASRSTIPVVLNTDTGSQPMILKTFIANCKSGKYSKFDEINITPNQDGTKIQKIEIR